MKLVIAVSTPSPMMLSQMSLQFAVGSSKANEAAPGLVVTLIHFWNSPLIPAGAGGGGGGAYA